MVEVCGYLFLGSHRIREGLTAFPCLKSLLYSTSQFVSATIVYGQVYYHSGKHCGLCNDIVDFCKDLLRQTFALSGMYDLDLVLPIEVELRSKVIADEPHQESYFLFGTAPILGGKGVERQVGNSQGGCKFDYFLSCRQAFPMPFRARQPLARSPAAVSIHYDSYMCRQIFRFHIPRCAATIR
jgi:hypothetical protein